MQRSAISVISLSTDTGRSTRTHSPHASSAPINSRRLSSAIVDGADPAAQDVVAYRPEPGGAQPAGERLGSGKTQHRLWQVSISIPLFLPRQPHGGGPPPGMKQI